MEGERGEKNVIQHSMPGVPRGAFYAERPFWFMRGLKRYLMIIPGPHIIHLSCDVIDLCLYAGP